MDFISAIMAWVILFPVHIGGWISKYPLAPIAVLCCTTEDGKYLTAPFEWAMTQDNDLTGDNGWKSEHIDPDSDPMDYWNRVGWLWRNWGHGINYGLIGIESNKNINPEYEPGLMIREDGFWLWRDRFQITDQTDFEVMWGWNIFGTINDSNKYAFTNRFKDRGKP